MKHYKYCFISEIPQDWKIVTLDDLIEIETGKREKGGGLPNGTVPSVGGEHIDNSGNIIWNDLKFVSEEFYNNLNQGKVKIGDILLVKDGATTGKVTIAKQLFYDKVAVNEHVFIIRSKFNLINEFLFYVLYSQLGQRQIKTKFHGLIGGIKREDIKKIQIPLPPLPEQKKIAEVLSTVDEAIAKVDEKIKKTERLKKGLMQKLLTKGIGHKEFKYNKELGYEIPKEWDIVSVKDLFDIETGTTPSTKIKEYWENGTINWFTPNDLSKLNNQIKLHNSERKISETAFKEANLSLMPKGSIIISTRAPVGYIGILEQPATFNQGCKGLRIQKNKDVSADFYCYYFLYKKYILQNLSGGSTFRELSKDFLEKFSLPYPKKLEQLKIAEILSTIDKKLELERKRKEKLERIKKGLMNDLLTGKKRVHPVR